MVLFYIQTLNQNSTDSKKQQTHNDKQADTGKKAGTQQPHRQSYGHNLSRCTFRTVDICCTFPNLLYVSEPAVTCAVTFMLTDADLMT